jgi:hypothetical protein
MKPLSIGFLRLLLFFDLSLVYKARDSMGVTATLGISPISPECCDGSITVVFIVG